MRGICSRDAGRASVVARSIANRQQCQPRAAENTRLLNRAFAKFINHTRAKSNHDPDDRLAARNRRIFPLLVARAPLLVVRAMNLALPDASGTLAILYARPSDRSRIG